ncbi:hypothetical protein XENTR_v10002302 [Xenopus tropicalis]|nr:hypothetical protein XENTR_v10002302 [Xenopus tropicalis]
MITSPGSLTHDLVLVKWPPCCASKCPYLCLHAYLLDGYKVQKLSKFNEITNKGGPSPCGVDQNVDDGFAINMAFSRGHTLEQVHI